MAISNKAFHFNGDDRGVLCVHGFSGTPFEIRYLAEQLHAKGFSVKAPLLAGHGTKLEELDRITWPQWMDNVSQAFLELRQQCQSVAVVGQSLGGLLTLELATRFPDQIDALATLATPLWLSPLNTSLVRAFQRNPMLSRLIKNVPKWTGSDVRCPRAKQDNPSYKAMSTKGVLQVHALMEEVIKKLPEVHQPLLTMHATQDHTAPVACAKYIQSHVSSAIKEMHILSRSYHLIAIDVEKEIVAAEVSAFLENHLAKPKATP